MAVIECLWRSVGHKDVSFDNWKELDFLAETYVSTSNCATLPNCHKTFRYTIQYPPLMELVTMMTTRLDLLQMFSDELDLLDY